MSKQDFVMIGLCVEVVSFTLFELVNALLDCIWLAHSLIYENVCDGPKQFIIFEIIVTYVGLVEKTVKYRVLVF